MTKMPVSRKQRGTGFKSDFHMKPNPLLTPEQEQEFIRAAQHTWSQFHLPNAGRQTIIKMVMDGDNILNYNPNLSEPVKQLILGRFKSDGLASHCLYLLRRAFPLKPKE
jgi:hypothetical protein